MSKKYRPANGSEGMRFMARFCDRCAKEEYDERHPEKGCRILAATMAFDVDDEEYPDEWTYDQDGKPTCTAFEAER